MTKVKIYINYMIERHQYLIYEGRARTIEFAVRPNGKIPAKKFFDGLPEKVQDYFLSIFKESIGDTASMKDSGRFHKLIRKVYDIKKGKKIRFLSVQGKGRKIIITHGFFKKTNKVDVREIETAERWAEEHEKITGGTKGDR